MLKFREFLEEAALSGVGVISATGNSIYRYKQKYLDPYEGSSEFSHTIANDRPNFPTGTKVRIKSSVVHLDDAGKKVLHVFVQNEQGHRRWMRSDNLHKPVVAKNKGSEYESNFVKRLNDHGLMKGEGAGFSGGTDFHLINKKQDTNHPGVVNGETKLNKTAALGQLTIRYDREKGGWHIPERNRANREQFASHVDNVQIHGQSILDYMNQHHRPDENPIPHGYKRYPTITTGSGSYDLEPAHAYLADHHADIVHIGSTPQNRHGTYYVGGNNKTGLNLPRLSGKGHFEIRQKDPDDINSRTIAFRADHFKPSHFDLDNDDHLEQAKQVLGHK